jgi:hypothetical protein
MCTAFAHFSISVRICGTSSLISFSLSSGYPS